MMVLEFKIRLVYIFVCKFWLTEISLNLATQKQPDFSLN